MGFWSEIFEKGDTDAGVNVLDFVSLASWLATSTVFASVFSSTSVGTSLLRSTGVLLTAGAEIPLALSSFARVGVAINRGLSVTSGAGVGEAVLSAPGDGVRGGSAVVVGELTGFCEGREFKLKVTLGVWPSAYDEDPIVRG